MKRHQNPRIHTHPNGFSLVEISASLGIVALFLAIFIGSSQNITALRSTRYRSLALSLVREELEAIRNTPFAKLTNRTNASFMNVVSNRGIWSVIADATAPSSPNIYSIQLPGGTTNGLSGVAILPAGKHDNATLESAIKVLPSSPSGWRAGLLFRTNDISNTYWARFQSSSITLGKTVAGVESTLFTKSQSFSTNTWYTVKVVLNGTALTLYLNGTLLTTTAVTDASFEKGWFALSAWEGAAASFDSVSFIASTTETWAFDTGETIGNVAAGWTRVSSSSLPAAQEKLTIADAVSGQSGLKRINVRLEWIDGIVTKATEMTTYIAQGGIAQ